MRWTALGKCGLDDEHTAPFKARENGCHAEEDVAAACLACYPKYRIAGRWTQTAAAVGTESDVDEEEFGDAEAFLAEDEGGPTQDDET